MANHSKFALSHAECRKKVCFVCFGKNNAKRYLHTNPGLQASISTKFKISFEGKGAIDLKDDRVPLGVCNSCFSKINRDSPKLELAHSNFDFFVVHVSPSGICNDQCMICLKAKSKLSNLLPFQGRIRKKVNKPTSSLKCDRCHSRIGKGLKHHCTNSTSFSNICNIVNDPSNSKLGEAVASKVLKEAPKSADGSVSLHQYSGKPLKVNTSAAFPASPKPQVSLLDLIKLQIDNNFGDAQTRNVATFINGIFGRGAVEPYFQEKLSFAYNFFEDDFSVSTPTFTSTGKTPILFESTLIHVNNLGDFIMKVFEERGLNYQDYDVKLGIDKGQGILKFTVSFAPKAEADVNGYSENCFAKQSVNDLFIVAACSGVEETPSNLRIILELIGASDAKFFYIGDLKVINMLAGIQSHSCMHPCYACVQHKDHLGDGPSSQRTVGSTMADHDAFLRTSQKPADSQAHNNVKFHPLICLDASDLDDPSKLSVPLLFLIPPPELHLMLGPFKDFYRELLKIFPEAAKWPLHVFKTEHPWHGGEYNGNDIRDLLACVDFLQSLAEQHCNFQAIPFVELFRAFKRVIESCFGGELKEGYLDRISELRCAIQQVGISVTSKMHIILFHVPEWCEHFKKPLGLYSEQALESSHRKFKKFSDKYLVGKLNPKFGEKLKRAVTKFNSMAHFHILFTYSKMYLQAQLE